MSLNIENYNRQHGHKNVLIHVGKCGGSTLRGAIKHSKKVKITGVMHIRKPFATKQNFYIVLRDPISRCISAFNWRYKLVVEDRKQHDRFDGEHEILSKYKTLNALAEKLYDDTGKLDKEIASDFERIHHLHERISFYLEDFLKEVNERRIKGVFMQETLNDDIQEILGVAPEEINTSKQHKTNSGLTLTTAGKRNLVRYIQSDYQCILKLYQYGHIKEETMLKIFSNAFS